MQRKLVSFAMLLADILVIAFVPVLAFYVRFDGAVGSIYYQMVWAILPTLICGQILVFYLSGLYHRLWKYASIRELVIIVGSVGIGTVLLHIYCIASVIPLPRSIYILYFIFTILLIGGSRLSLRIMQYILHRLASTKGETANVLIVGAGDAGAMIAREINQRYYESKHIVGFIDDSEYKTNQILFGAKVLGTCDDIADVVEKYSVNEIIIAMPSVDGSIVRKIIKECQQTQCQVKTLPGIYELIDGKVSVQQLRNVALEDLLRRDPVKLNLAQLASYLSGKRVLVTGAGGSIGSELCRQIAKTSPATLVLLGKGENSIYEIHQELKGKFSKLQIEPVIADIRDKQRIHQVFGAFKPQVVFHAAAHKHVPLMEAQPIEAVRNNIFGTKTVAEAADAFGTEIFVMISTDKAVNPTSVMGATKRVAELIIQNLSKISDTKFVAVRFGNVLGSRGSVIPLFKKQIAKGGPITITHPDMKRYFMTIPEASQLVLQAGAIAKGGEVFVLDMGEPVKIVDMAHDLIELSGLVPDKDIQVKFTGLRPGEKLFEELLTAEEGTASTKHQKIFVANLKTVDEKKLQQGIMKLTNESDSNKIIKIIAGLVPTYKYTMRVNSEVVQTAVANTREIYDEQPNMC